MTTDKIYALPHERVGDFAFDAAVAEVFPDMIRRSVPGYASVLSMIEQLTERFVLAESNVYDLGCSLGAATLLIQRHAAKSVAIHAVDNSAAMIQRLAEQLDVRRSEEVPLARVLVHEADVCETPMSNASFVLLNWTLQFIPAHNRLQLIQRIFDALLPGGALLLSEKICFDDSQQQELLDALHHDFKRANGYSDLEIAQKRTAIENRLIPESMETHIERLHQVGFAVVAPWFQCFNFVSILAVKQARAS